MTTVLITGANRGIGLELASRYAARGDRVLACCRSPADATALNDLAAQQPGLTVHGVVVTDGASVASLASAIGVQPLDILINNAGSSPPMASQSLAAMDYDAWADSFAVNTMAPVRTLQALRGNLASAKGAKAITITSQMGALSFNVPVAYAYSAAKAAVNKVMRLAGIELAKEGTIVALVHPGWVRTDMGGASADISPEESAAGIMAVIDRLTIADAGSFFKWNGDAHAW